MSDGDEWLSSVLRSTTSSYQIHDATSRNSSHAPPRDPRFQKIIAELRFSRSLILSYNVVLLGLLFVFTVRHWRQQARWAQRRRERAKKQKHGKADDIKGLAIVEERETQASSSSDSSSGRSTPELHTHFDSRDVSPEEASLLLRTRRRSIGTTSRLRHLTVSWLIYQPQPIPYINKTLPSNGTTLAVMVLVALNTFYCFYRLPLNWGLLPVFAIRTGLLFVANFPLLYLLAAKNQPIKFLTGYSYEALNIFHRRLGEVMCLLALFHAVGMFSVWYMILRPAGITLIRFLLLKIIILGICALLAYELIYFTSLGSFRQRWYELFLILHVGLQVAALALLYFHHRNTRIYVGVALGIYVVDRVVYRLGLKKYQTRADLTVLEDGETVMVSANWQLQRKPSLLHRILASNIKDGWRPTDHIFLNVPSIATEHMMEFHPFTIASAAPLPPLALVASNDDNASSHAWFSLVIRAHDGFSRHLVTYARSHPATTICLDGPYGSQNAVGMLLDSDVSIIVAGGSGIAVAFPLVWTLLEQVNPSASFDVEIARTDQTSRKKVILIWVVHDRSHLSWIDDERLRELEERGLELIIPQPTAEAGRPDVGQLVGDAVRKHTNSGSRRQSSQVGVVVSGPDGMNRAVRNKCSELVASGYDIDVDVEKFGW